MNKNTIFSIIIVIILGLGLWWITSNTKPGDSGEPTPLASASISPSASPTSSPTKTPIPSPAITITSPKTGDTVDVPVTLTGRARVFENQFTVRVKDSAGAVLYQTSAMTDAKDAGLYGNYSVKLPIPVSGDSNLKIEAYALSPKGDGTYEGYASVAVKLKTLATSTIYAAFMTGSDCQTASLFPREIIKSSEFVYLSLVELLKGPTLAEIAQGAVTQIPTGVKINSFRQTGNTGYADFDQTLQQGVTGACRIQSISTQITSTLEQFLGLQNVVISINGNSHNIFNP